jgi:hypothetical protein
MKLSLYQFIDYLLICSSFHFQTKQRPNDVYSFNNQFIHVKATNTCKG